MNTGEESANPTVTAERLAQIEARLARLEARLPSAPDRGQSDPVVADPTSPPAFAGPTPGGGGQTEEEFEFVLGQKWFAHAGILVLALGAAFTLSLPYPNLPPALPTVLGYLLAGSLFALAHRWRESFALVSSYLRAAAMALLFMATLRLFFFTPTPALSTATFLGQSILLAVAGLNLTIALRRRSKYLFGLALVMGYATVLLLTSTGLVFPMIAALAALVVYAWVRHRWPLVLWLGIGATYLTHFLWAVGHPWRGGEFRFVHEPLASIFFVLFYGILLAIPALFTRDREEKDPYTIVSAFLNAGLCYGLFLLHSWAAFGSALVVSHLVASGVFLGLAAALWVVKHSQVACFFYAIMGYMAMSAAILKAFAAPNVFVWLSVQSVVVVATALWFRSPSIVVANFFIYLAMVLGYALVATRETGMSLGFGVVAMVSARILNWQKWRLRLRTEMMRNAYLCCVLALFPYALYHLVPRTYIAVSWIAVAAVYYALSLVIRNQKYRWMGHLTMVLTVFYVAIVGVVQLDMAQRIFSFLVLGTVLVAISMLFSRRRARERANPAKP